ncbi:hypothetical protein ACWGOQ_0008385 [Aquimarina sp. M1]
MKCFCVLLFSVILFSCSNDDDNVEPTLQGKWNLVNVSGGFAGLDEDIAKEIIVWDFNTVTGMVTIQNSITDASFNTVLESGTYPYSVSAPADADLLIVNEVSLGRFNLQSTSFTVEETFEDGFIFLFER